MKLHTIVETANTFSLKNGNIATYIIDKYDYVKPPQHAAYDIIVTIDGQRAGNFTLGIYEENESLIAQMDANVRKPFRRLGIASKIYDIGEKIAAKYGAKLQPAPDNSDVAKKFWQSRLKA